MKGVDLARPIAASIMLGVLLVLGGGAVTGLWLTLSSAEEERDAKAAFVSRSVRAEQSVQGKAGPQAEPMPLGVVAESETLAAARVDALIRSIAQEAGGSVLSSRADAKHDEAGLAGRIEIQVVVDAPNDAIQQMLYRIEAGTPMMIVDDLAIEPAVPEGSDPASDPSPKLHAALTLSAYWRGPQK